MAPRKREEDDDPASIAVTTGTGKQQQHLASPQSVASVTKFPQKSLPSEDADTLLQDLDIDLPMMAFSAIAPSLEQLSDRASTILERLDYDDKTGSILVKVCRNSLVTEISCMLTEARLVEKSTSDSAVAAMIPCKMALLQMRIQTYLEMIETALEQHPTLNSGLESMIDDSSVTAYSRVSPWTIPSLVFDVATATPVRHEFKPFNYTHVPLIVDISAIVEVFAADLSNSKMVSQPVSSCCIEVEKCCHEIPTLAGPRAIGSAFVRVKLNPLKQLPNREKRWGVHSDTENALHIKEARCVQVNAFPPQPRASVDLFTSSAFGERSKSISFCFHTFKTVKGETPVVSIELVMA